MMPGAGVTVLSEVAWRLMMIFGAGALTCATKCGGTAFSRLTKVTQPPSRRGHRRRRRAPEIALIQGIRSPSAGPIAVALEPELDRIEEILLSEGLGQELDRSANVAAS